MKKGEYMKKQFILITISIFLLTWVLYADEVEKLMKEVRLTYKELKKETKIMNEVALKDLLGKMNTLSGKMDELRIEENQEKFSELSREFSEKVKELEVLLEGKNPENFQKGMDGFKKTCVKCHSTFMNPVKRFFVDLFL